MRTLTVLTLGLLALGTSGLAMADDAAATREADRAAIEALMWRYVRALDSMDADGYAAVYTEDGSFGSGSQQRTGRADLAKMVADLKKGRDDRTAKGEKVAPMYHVIANHQITFTGPNAARYDSYWMTVFGAAGADTPPRVAAAGRGVDELVRIDGQWLIKNRNVAPQ